MIIKSILFKFNCSKFIFKKKWIYPWAFQLRNRLCLVLYLFSIDILHVYSLEHCCMAHFLMIFATWKWRPVKVLQCWRTRIYTYWLSAWFTILLMLSSLIAQLEHYDNPTVICFPYVSFFSLTLFLFLESPRIRFIHLYIWSVLRLWSTIWTYA